ncbi:MAG: hypothetical protein ACI9GM_001043 [Salibacteraceae bacterium]|jgi:hypothetical protein
MKFRVARHTKNLLLLKKFYTEVIGLIVLGDFENHEGYDGLFLGEVGENWHLEFTFDGDLPNSQPDPDDLFVFYVNSDRELENIKEQAIKNCSPMVASKNPYWNRNGITLIDPDGFRVVISVHKKK